MAVKCAPPSSPSYKLLAIWRIEPAAAGSKDLLAHLR